jgi:hypothetical protein
MLSAPPRSPLTPNAPILNEKKFDAGFLSPSAWKTRFSVSLGKNNQPAAGAEHHGVEMEMDPQISPRREAWDDRPASFIMVNERGQEEPRSGPGYVTIGAPPPSRKRTSNRGKVVNGVEGGQRSGSRNSILGRIFGSSDQREKDMEVTITITTQLDHLEDLEAGSRASLDGTSVGGGGSALGKDEIGSVSGDAGAEMSHL